MNRNPCMFCFLALTVAGLVGCSSQPAGTESKQTGTARDKIQGKVQIDLSETSANDAALNGGGPTVYLWEGLRRYRLFFNKAIKVDPGKEYIAEGVCAQKVIDEIGDPDQGKSGYPLQSSCERVVKMAWSGLAFDATDGHISALRARVKRFPARPVFLINRLTPVPPKKEDAASKEAKEEIPEVTVAAAKQRALLVEGSAVQPAPLWEPAGGKVSCEVLIGKDGKITELGTGRQLCEAVPWAGFRYQPTARSGRPVNVRTEVEVVYEPRK